jgi:serine/threonine protein kinase/TolA-binding protein
LTDSTPKPDVHPSRPGERIGRYDLVEALGKGAMGVVYHAYDPLLDRDVALKLMLPQIADEPDHKHRFEREARAVARLMHPNVVTLFDLGYHTDGSPYIAMELLRGEDLLRAMREGRPFTLPQKVTIIVQALDGLAHAHQAGIVHRDVKPANIFLTQDGTAKIMDFGVARFTTGAATGTGAVVGTVEYMSPEQVQGAHVDGRTDVFSAACVLCELVTGRRPFHGDTLVTILYKIVHDRPAIELPAGREYDLLRPLLERALARDPADRFQTAADFAAELRSYMQAAGDALPAEELAPPPPVDTTSVTAPALASGLRPPAAAASVPPAPVPPPPAPRSDKPPIEAADLFRVMREIYVGEKSGHLHFTHGPARRSLRFVSGHIVMGTSDVAGEHLGNVLVRFGLLTQAQLEKATEILLRDRKRLGTVLAELEMLPSERMTEAVGLHVREILFNVLDQRGGAYVFEETSAESILGPDLTVRIAPGEIILEATRRIQDARAIAKVVGNVDRLLFPSPHPLLRVQKIPLTPTDGFLLSRVDGTLTAREVFQLIPLRHEDVERSLFGLLCTGSVEYDRAVRSPGSGGLPRTMRGPVTGGPVAAAPRAPASAPAPPAARAAAPMPAPPARAPEPAPDWTGRARPRTDSSAAGRDLEVEKEHFRRMVEDLRRQITEMYDGLRTKDHFEILGIGREATERDVKDAYFRLAKPFHPDSHRDLPLEDLKDKRQSVFIRLGEAYDMLRNPESRARYERQYAPRATFRPAAPSPPPPPPPPAPAAPPAPEAAPYRPAAPDPAAEVRNAEALIRKEKYWDAIQLLEPLTAGGATGAVLTRAHLLLGQAYMKNPHWLKRAADQLQLAIDADPRNGEAHFTLGLVFKANGLNHRAATMFRKAVELMPAHVDAQRELAEIEGPAAPGRRKLFNR